MNCLYCTSHRTHHSYDASTEKGVVHVWHCEACQRDFEVLPDILDNTATTRIAFHPRRKAGSMKGQIKMSDDFDAPLEDFKDYEE